ncbi:MAG: thermonuclease family protein [Solirubrobacterales bacterium]
MRPRRPGRLAGITVLLILLAAGWLQTRDQGGSGLPAAAPETVKVDRVVDGDTVKVFYEGRSEYVRYIGIDTPESVDPDSPVECFGEEAKEFNDRLLRDGEVRLVFDQEMRDRYGRLLAYVYVGNLMLNAELLRKGFAQTLTISPNDAESRRFEKIEADARYSGVGLWSSCG